MATLSVKNAYWQAVLRRIYASAKKPAGQKKNVRTLKTRSKKRFRIQQLGPLGNRGVGSIYLPFNPLEVDEDNVGISYNEVARPLKRPLLVAEAPMLRTLDFDFVMADRPSGGQLPIDDKLKRLRQFALDDLDLRLSYGLRPYPKKWRITSFSFTTRTRNEGGGTLIADCNIQFTESFNLSSKPVKMKWIPTNPGGSNTSTSTGNTSNSSTPTSKPSGSTESNPPPPSSTPEAPSFECNAGGNDAGCKASKSTSTRHSGRLPLR